MGNYNERKAAEVVLENELFKLFSDRKATIIFNKMTDAIVKEMRKHPDFKGESKKEILRYHDFEISTVIGKATYQTIINDIAKNLVQSFLDKIYDKSKENS